MEVEFLHEVGAVLFDRLDADAEEVRDVLVLVAFGNQLQKFPFPLGRGFPQGSNRGGFFPCKRPSMTVPEMLGLRYRRPSKAWRMAVRSSAL